MQAISKFIKATVVGGIFFLVPVVLLIVILQHAVGLAEKLVGPLFSAIDAHTIAGIGVTTVIACTALLAVCFLVGLAANTSPGKRFSAWLEDIFLGNLPGYRMHMGLGSKKLLLGRL